MKGETRRTWRQTGEESVGLRTTRELWVYPFPYPILSFALVCCAILCSELGCVTLVDHLLSQMMSHGAWLRGREQWLPRCGTCSGWAHYLQENQRWSRCSDHSSSWLLQRPLDQIWSGQRVQNTLAERVILISHDFHAAVNFEVVSTYSNTNVPYQSQIVCLQCSGELHSLSVP